MKLKKVYLRSAQAWLIGQKGTFEMENLTLDYFLSQVETTFLCRLENGDAASMRLVEATATGQPSMDRMGSVAPFGRRAFSLIFLGSPDFVLPQGIYRLEHAEMGTLDIFLVPIGREASGARYQAIFN